MSDLYAAFSGGLDSPAVGGFDVSLHNTNVLSIYTRAIMVATAGNVKVTTIAGDEVVLPALQPGVMYGVRAKIIWNTGTTATGVVGLY
jgi:hypothetical protein